MNNLVKLNVIGITYTQEREQSMAYALVLGEENGDRRIPIVVGTAEAQSIAMYLQGITASRPLTHDLFSNVLNQFLISLRRVIIYKMEESLFFAELWFLNAAGEKTRIEARPSDAIALAVRMQAPIYTTEEIMSKVGVPTQSNEPIIDIEDTSNEEEDIASSLETLSENELQEKLNEAIKNEAYEKAALLQKEINRRKPE